MKTYIITFYSHFSAIACKKTLTELQYEVVLMPVPRALSSSCGTCIKLQTKDELSFFDTDGIEGVFIQEANISKSNKQEIQYKLIFHPD